MVWSYRQCRGRRLSRTWPRRRWFCSGPISSERLLAGRASFMYLGNGQTLPLRNLYRTQTFEDTNRQENDPRHTVGFQSISSFLSGSNWGGTCLHSTMSRAKRTRTISILIHLLNAHLSLPTIPPTSRYIVQKWSRCISSITVSTIPYW